MNPTKQNWKLQRPTPTGLHIVTDDTLELPIATVFLPEGGGTASQRAERQQIAELIVSAPRLSRAAIVWSEAAKETPESDKPLILATPDGAMDFGYWDGRDFRANDAMKLPTVRVWAYAPSLPFEPEIAF